MSVMSPETDYLRDLGTPENLHEVNPQSLESPRTLDIFFPFVLVPNSGWGMLPMFPSDSLTEFV